MKKIIIILSALSNVIALVLMLNLFGIPVHVKPDCGMGWLLMAMAFFYLPIAIVISIICYVLLRLSKKKLLHTLSLAFLVLVFIFEVVYSVLRIQVSSEKYECPENMKINYEEVL